MPITTDNIPSDGGNYNEPNNQNDDESKYKPMLISDTSILSINGMIIDTIHPLYVMYLYYGSDIVYPLPLVHHVRLHKYKTPQKIARTKYIKYINDKKM